MEQQPLLKDQVYQQIIKMICTGELMPDRTFSENEMIEHFGVSKSPVREALIQLCHEDILVSIPRCGYRVIRIEKNDIHDITELRLYLELSSLPRILDRMDKEKLDELNHQNELRRFVEKDPWEAWENNVRFHLTLNSYSGNMRVYKALERALATCTRGYAQLYHDHRSVLAPTDDEASYHDLIVSALTEHDLFSAHEYLKKDILLMEQQILLHYSAENCR